MTTPSVYNIQHSPDTGRPTGTYDVFEEDGQPIGSFPYLNAGYRELARDHAALFVRALELADAGAPIAAGLFGEDDE